MVYVTHDQIDGDDHETLATHCGIARRQAAAVRIPSRHLHPARQRLRGGFHRHAVHELPRRPPRRPPAQGGCFRCGEWSLPIGALSLTEEQPKPDGRVRLGIRPEHIRIDGQGEAARVALVEPTGHETILVLNYSGSEIVARMDGEVSTAARRLREAVFPGGKAASVRRFRRQAAERRFNRMTRTGA